MLHVSGARFVSLALRLGFGLALALGTVGFFLGAALGSGDGFRLLALRAFRRILGALFGLGSLTDCALLRFAGLALGALHRFGRFALGLLGGLGLQAGFALHALPLGLFGGGTLTLSFFSGTHGLLTGADLFFLAGDFGLARRLGFAVQVSMGALPPGMPELLDDFIRSAHDFMYHRYSVMRLRRMFTWDLAAGMRFYDVDGNVDDCPRVLNPDKLEWVGISQGDSSWQPLICGINPVLYGSAITGIPSHYEIRQCIEIWPAPADDSWKLRIKGDFGPSPVEADGDVLTVDPEAVFLQALANAKAHYGQADAGNYASQATAYVRSKVAGSHQTRRYIPGSCPQPPAVRPVLKED